MTRITETLIGYTTNEKLIHTLVTLALARPDLVEGFALVANSAGLRRTFLAELQAAHQSTITIEPPERRLLPE